MALRNFIVHPYVYIFSVELNRKAGIYKDSIVECNESLLSNIGVSRKSISLNGFRFLSSLIHADDFKKVQESALLLMQNKECFSLSEMRIKLKTSDEYESQRSICILQYANEKPLLVCMMVPEIKQLQIDEIPVKMQLLSERERSIADYIKSGISSKEIALSLNISEETVKTHRRNIRGKLKVSTNTQLLQVLYSQN